MLARLLGKGIGERVIRNGYTSITHSFEDLSSLFQQVTCDHRGNMGNLPDAR